MKKTYFGFILTAFIFLFVLSLTAPARAYIDPGTLGVIYQVGYLIFYGIVGVLIFFFRPIKKLFLKIKAKITGKEQVVETAQDETADSQVKKSATAESSENTPETSEAVEGESGKKPEDEVENE